MNDEPMPYGEVGNREGIAKLRPKGVDVWGPERVCVSADVNLDRIEPGVEIRRGGGRDRGRSLRSRALGPWFALATGALATVIPSTLGPSEHPTISPHRGSLPTAYDAFVLTVHAVLWAMSIIAGVSCPLPFAAVNRRP